jgi:hypothetical protein
MTKKTTVRFDRKYRQLYVDGKAYPVIDAEHDEMITPSEDDHEEGIPGDAFNCMYCLAWRRTQGAEFVCIVRTVGYVQVKGPGGKPEVWRFILDGPAKEDAKAFDEGQQFVPQSVWFLAPRGSRRLDYRWVSKGRNGSGVYARGNIKKTNRTPWTARDPGTGKFRFGAQRMVSVG